MTIITDAPGLLDAQRNYALTPHHDMVRLVNTAQYESRLRREENMRLCRLIDELQADRHALKRRVKALRKALARECGDRQCIASGNCPTTNALAADTKAARKAGKKK